MTISTSAISVSSSAQVRNNFNMETFPASYQEFLDTISASGLKLDLDILLYSGEDPTGGLDIILQNGKRSQHYRNICHFNALGGLLPKSVKAALAKGELYAWSPTYTYPWCTEVLKLEYISKKLEVLKPGSIVLIKPDKNGRFNKNLQELIAVLTNKGVIFKTLDHLYAKTITEAIVTVDDCRAYLHNIGAKETAPNQWELKVVKRNYLKFEYDPAKDNWAFTDGTEKQYFRNFHAFNGHVPASQKQTAFVAVVNYLITGVSVDNYKGRKAYLSDVFEDIIYIGYSHKLLDKFNSNKLGNLSVAMRANKCLPTIAKSRDLISAATAYEDLGHSVFLHKGANYLVIDAECAFFSRQNGKTSVGWQSDKRAKLTGRNLFSVATAGSIDETATELTIGVTPSNVYSRDLNGELFNYSGIEYYEAAVASPLVEDGSGQGLGHPETTRTFATKTKVKAVFPLYVQTEDQLFEQIAVAAVGTELRFGDPVITQKSILAKSGYVTMRAWDSLIPGEVISKPVIKHNDKTNTVDVSIDCIHKQTGDAEKFRGFCKYRSNGGFLKNIAIYSGDELVFNPNLPLHNDAGELQQVEHCIGGEEYKTLLFVISLLADQMPGGKAIWNSVQGEWENKEILERLIESNCKRVTVTRWGIEASCYQMLKDTYGDNPDFEFNDEDYEVVHSNALCWNGTHANIVEVPLTNVFVGKTKLFAEHIAYLGTEYQDLYQAMLQSVISNQALVKSALDVVQGNIAGETEDNPYGNYLVVDNQTLMMDSDKITVNLKTEDGIKFCSRIQIKGEYNWEFLTALAAKLSKNNIPGFVIEATDGDGEEYPIVLPLDIILSLTGTISHKIVRNIIQIMLHLETAVDSRSTGGWTAKFYRYVRLLEASLEEEIINSNALLAKATKTKEIAFTCRAGTTIDASVALDELHLHPDLAYHWGITESDTAIIGRVPVPGAGALKVRFNADVPYGTAVCNAATKHAIEEGDSDGDSMIIIVVDQAGNLVKPKNNIPSISVLG